MIDRRSFLTKNVPAAALASSVALSAHASPLTSPPEDPPAPYVLELVILRLHFGTQINRLSGWIEKRALPLFHKHQFGPMGYFTVEVGEHIPAVVAIRAYSSLAEMEAAWKRIDADAEWIAALRDLEVEGPAFHREDGRLLLATPFSLPLKPTAPGEPKHGIYELRIYESPTYKQLGFLHDRFAGGEIDLFHKSGIHPVFYADTVIGPRRPNMTYLIPFESEAHREKAWAAFRDNPDWQTLRAESVQRGGEIVRNITNMLLLPTSFSMLR